MRKGSGTITVFLSLTGILLLSLLCSLVESARLQGARAKAAMLTDIGLFSAFGEYEAGVLETFDVLVLDGAYGGGELESGNISKRLREYMKPVTSDRNFELMTIELKECEVSGYTLVTDDNAGVFYQKAVESQKQLMALDLLQGLQKTYEEARKQEEAGKACEENSKQIETEIEHLEMEGEQQKEEETDQGETKQEQENPLKVIGRIKKMGILALVMKNPSEISDKSINVNEFPSGRVLKKGNLELGEKQEGIVSDGIFLEYLKRHFADFRSVGEGSLSYEREYILMGKNSDEKNLKGVVNRLLLMREGSNFLYAMGNETMKQQALVLAAALAGAAAIPGLVTAVKMALLLAWAYGESLLDVRMLLSGGKVPVVKTAESWKLSLENLGKLAEVLESCDSQEGEGADYGEYLQMLLALGKKESYPMRALDILEVKIKEREDCREFLVDSCMVKIKVETQWELRPVFLRVIGAFLKTGDIENKIWITGCFGY